MKTEIDDRGKLNHITIVPPTTKNEQWKQNDSMVMSWIIENIDRDHIKCFLDYATSAHELWTKIQFILGPILLPLVNDPIQREVERGRNRDTGKESKENRGDHPSTAHDPPHNG